MFNIPSTHQTNSALIKICEHHNSCYKCPLGDVIDNIVVNCYAKVIAKKLRSIALELITYA